MDSVILDGCTQNRHGAIQSDADAQFNLGWMYENGRGVIHSDEKASMYYRLSAEQGNADAQCNLGWMFANGRGVSQSDDEAVRYFKMSADQGNSRGQRSLLENSSQ